MKRKKIPGKFQGIESEINKYIVGKKNIETSKKTRWDMAKLTDLFRREEKGESENIKEMLAKEQKL